jgi:hypothetical protein
MMSRTRKRFVAGDSNRNIMYCVWQNGFLLGISLMEKLIKLRKVFQRGNLQEIKIKEFYIFPFTRWMFVSKPANERYIQIPTYGGKSSSCLGALSKSRPVIDLSFLFWDTVTKMELSHDTADPTSQE